MTESGSKILIIDDEAEILSTTSKMLNVYGFKVATADNPEKAISQLNNEEFDLILCDLLIPGTDGMELLRQIKNSKKNIPVIIFSAYGTVDRAVACMKAGAFDFIEKPFEADHLKLVIDKALSYKQLSNERDNLLKQLEDKYKFENIIGKGPAMLKIFEMVESISESEANVLITGESGTGKELIARSLHARSKRKTKAFVPVNCGALPESLFEAELFGYEKGAFTNASQRKLGLLEYADKGTFFLDEVCELPINLQTKLLRVLQNKELRRLGGNEIISVDLRWISATNKNIEESLKKELLREDFYYRLNVINIHIPPLRERKEDIRLLADYFLKNNLKISGQGNKDFSENVIDAFQKYNWPGNVRELENTVERAVAFSKNDLIDISDLPEKFRIESSSKQVYNNTTLNSVKQRAVASEEKKYINYLLDKYQGNVTKAAEEAGITRRNIYLLLKKHKINPQNWR